MVGEVEGEREEEVGRRERRRLSFGFGFLILLRPYPRSKVPFGKSRRSRDRREVYLREPIGLEWGNQGAIGHRGRW